MSIQSVLQNGTTKCNIDKNAKEWGFVLQETLLGWPSSHCCSSTSKIITEQVPPRGPIPQPMNPKYLELHDHGTDSDTYTRFSIRKFIQRASPKKL